MTITPPPDVSCAADAAGGGKARPRLKQLIFWPPRVTWAFGRPVTAEPGDVVVSVEQDAPFDDAITLRVVKPDGQEYGAELFLPQTIVEELRLIAVNMTIRELGELEIL